MDDQLQHILTRHDKDFEGWYENIRDYQEQFILPYNPHWDDIASEPIYMEGLLRRLLEIFISYAGKRDTWEWHESLEYGTGFSTGIRSQQIEHAYLLGIDKDSIYFETTIAYPQSIHKIFDRFVHAIADYSRFGVFSYNESQIFDDYILSAHRGLLKKKIKGQLPDLLRHYFIAKAELDCDFDFGFLEIKWPLHQFSMQQFLTEGCKAFEIIHRLNTELWKKSKSSKQKHSPPYPLP